jgi:hypothetical protein
MELVSLSGRMEKKLYHYSETTLRHSHFKKCFGMFGGFSFLGGSEISHLESFELFL